ncbi:MAG: AAA family ATPase [candidate division WOR-3 bacterium]
MRFKKIYEVFKKKQNLVFVYGDSNFLGDLFYYNGAFFEIRDLIIEIAFKHFITNYLIIFKEKGKIKLKTNFDISKKVLIKDELEGTKTIETSIKEKSFNDLQSFLNEIKSINEILVNKNGFCVIFDNFESISEIYKGFNTDTLSLVFKDTILNWKDMNEHYFFIIIRDKTLGKLEDFGIDYNKAIEISKPSIHEVGQSFYIIAKNENKILLRPLDNAKIFLQDDKQLKIIIDEFKEKIKNVQEKNINLAVDGEEKWNLDKVRINKETKEKIRQIFEKFRRGESIINGIILYGPPGTGKTTIAKALAEESKFYFMKTSASDFKGEYIGQSGQNTRRIFEELKNNKPSVLFIDEADAILLKRDIMRSDSYIIEIVNEFLANVDGLKSDKEVFIVISTNNINLLDDAILSRFEKIEIPLPDREILKELIRDYFGNYSDYFIRYVDYFVGLSGRDIRNLGEKLKQNIISKEKLLDEVLLQKLAKLEPIFPKIKFSDICGYDKQKQIIINYLSIGIKRFVVCGNRKVGKTTFINAFGGEINGIIIRKFEKEIIKNIDRKIILFLDENNFNENFEELENLIICVESHNNEFENYLENLGFEKIILEIDKETIESYIRKLGLKITDIDILALEGKSFPYIENQIKKLKGG